MKENESKNPDRPAGRPGEERCGSVQLLRGKEGDPGRALSLAETLLQVNPADVNLLRKYTATAAQK